MRVIVCGGRNFQYAVWLYEILDAIHAETPITLVVEGGQRTYERDPRTGKQVCVGGADYWASVWAKGRGIELVTMPANWQELGPKAGPIRNAEMLARYVPNRVVAFPGGDGTADMIRKARAAGVRVDEIVLPK